MKIKFNRTSLLNSIVLNHFSQILLLLVMSLLSTHICAQNDDLLEKMRIKDSLASEKSLKIYRSNVVTSELRNVLFREIYRVSNYNEEAEFNRKLELFKPFEDLQIDTIIIRKFPVFGANVYDTSQKPSGFEKLLNSVHITTKDFVLIGRYLLFRKGDYFSSYRAMENTRLIRSSRIFNDARFIPTINSSGHLDLYLYIQDVFPYGFDFSFNAIDNFGLGIENVNLLGIGHQMRVATVYNAKDMRQSFGAGVYYKIPNVFKSNFIDVSSFFENYTNLRSYGASIGREFSRPEFRWAGGALVQFINQDIRTSLSNNLYNDQKIENELWLSHAFPFKSIQYKTTQNAIVVSAKFNYYDNIVRPANAVNQPQFWDEVGILGSLGYARFRYVQDRLLNGFGRTEDVPIGISTNLLYGTYKSEFGSHQYYGAQLLGQYYSRNNTYFNIGLRFGQYVYNNFKNRGVFDLNIQSASHIQKIGKLRLRHFINGRFTIGFNQDSFNFIFLSREHGIRGINNASIEGHDRITAALQSNLYMPFSILGFRSYLFSLIEVARMRKIYQSNLSTPLYSGVSFGAAFKNENMIFDLIQIQYGIYLSTKSNVSKSGLVISTVLPFRFQRLDISKPSIVKYQ